MDGNDVITIIFDANTKAFQKGTRSIKTAISSLERTVRGFSNKSISSFKKLIPLVSGVGSVFGVLSKAVSTYMSQHEALGAKLNAVWTALGNLIGPIIEKIVDLIATATSYFIAFMNVLGITSKKASELSKRTGEIAKTLAGFDELNVLQESNEGKLEDKDLPALLNSLAEFLKNKMWDDAAQIIIDRFNSIIKTFAEQAEHFGIVASDYVQGALHIIARVLDEVDWHTLGEGIANFFNGLLREIEGIPLGEDIGKIIAAKFTIAFKIVTGFLENIDMKRMGEILTGIVTGAVDSIVKAIDEADFKKIGEQIALFFASIDWNKIKEEIIKLFTSLWNAAVDFLWGLVAGDPENEPPTIGALRKLGDSIGKFLGNITEVLGQVWDDLKRYAQDIINSEKVAKAINWLAEAIDSIGNFCERHKEAIAALIEGIGVALISYKLADNIIKVASAIYGILGPVGLVVAAVVVFIGWLVNLYETNDEFREKVDNAWAKVKSVIGSVVDWVSDKIQKFKEIIEKLKEKFAEFREKGTEAFDGVRNSIGTAVGGIVGFFSKIKDGLEKLKDKFSDFKDKAGKKWEEVKEKLSWGNIKETLVSGFDTVRDGIVGVIDKLKRDASESWENFKNKFHLDGFRDKLVGAFENVKTGIKTTISNLKRDASEDWENLKSKLHIDGLKEKLTTAFGNVKTGIIEKVRGLKSDTADYMEGIKTSWEGMKNKVSEHVQELINKKFKDFKNDVLSIKDKFSEMKKNVEETWENLKNTLKVDDIKKKLLDGFGEVKKETLDIFKKLREELIKKTDEIQKETNENLEKISKKFQDLKEKYESLSTTFRKLGNELSTYVETTYGKIATKVSTVASTCYSSMKKAWEDIKTKVSNVSNDLIKGAETLRSNIASKYEAIKTEVISNVETMRSTVSSKWESLKSTVSTHAQTLKTNVTTTISSMVTTVGTNLSSVATTLTNTFTNIKNTFETIASSAYNIGKSLLIRIWNGIVESWNSTVGNNIQKLVSSILKLFNFSSVENQGKNLITNLNNGIVGGWNNGNIRTNLSSMRESILKSLIPASETVKSWGRDMITSLNNGIVGAFNSGNLMDNVKKIAQSIKNVLGFSEPKEGPLSDFHTYGPDMMKLYAESILHSKNVVFDAVGDIASGITERLENAGGGGLEAGMEALSQLQKSSNWKMPDVAGGGFTPYQIAASAMSDMKMTERTISDSVAELSSAIGDLKYSLENMQWVAQFGSVRAFVRECQKVEKQMGRELGV